MERYRLLFLTFFFLTGVCRVLLAHHPGLVPPAAMGARDGETEANNISSANMINSPTASTLGRNHAALGFAFQYSNFNAIPAENAYRLHESRRDIHGKRHEETYNIYAGFGALEDLDLYLVIPIVSKTSTDTGSHHEEGGHGDGESHHKKEDEDHEHREEHGNEPHDHREGHGGGYAGSPVEDTLEGLGQRLRSSGFGDMRLIAKYRFLKKYAEGALLAGVKFPTGETDGKDKSGNKFETEQQPGSGSWDGEFGIMLSRSFFRRLSAATSFQYFLKGEGAQQRKLGDVFRYSAGVSYALRSMGKYPNLNIGVEVNHEWTLRDHSREEDRVFDSGGTQVFITPGVTAQVTKNLSFFWGMPVPIYQNLGGEHEELQIQVLAGASLYI